MRYFCIMKAKEFEQKVAAFASDQAMFSPDDKVLVALSGGADSVALLRFLLSQRVRCVAAHCNFHLRGEESNRDERFVGRLCEQLGVPLRIRHFDVGTFRHDNGMSDEMACRALRYRWFSELLETDNCSVVAVAHHRDDNVETFFLNALRGTGLAGLAGMRAVHEKVVRPLLCATRGEVLEYLHELGQEYVTDSTNRENHFLRNRLRNVVLPVLESEFPDAFERLTDTMDRVADGRALYEELVNHMEREARVKTSQGVIRYSLAVLRQMKNCGTLLFELLREYGFNREQCEAVFGASVGSVFLSSTKALFVGREYIEIQDKDVEQEGEIFVDFGAGFPRPWLQVEGPEVPFSPSLVDGHATIALSAGVKACKRVVLRRWRRGDRLSPYGMRGSKLVSDLFVDAKLSAADKKAVWLLEADGLVLWVIGLRASRHYAVAPGSTGYVLLRYCRSSR